MSNAMVYLSKAVSAGFIEVALIEENPDFASLRQLEAFRALICCLKTTSGVKSNPGFLQYYLSSLQSGQQPKKNKLPIQEEANNNSFEYTGTGKNPW